MDARLPHPSIDAVPGMPSILDVVLTNTGARAVQATVRVLGVPTDAAGFTTVSLPAGGSTTVPVGVVMPVGSPPGTHAVRVEIMGDDGTSTLLDGAVVVYESGAVSLRLAPTTVMGNYQGEFKVLLHNRGDRSADLRLSGESDDGRLRFRFRDSRIQLLPGERAEVEAKVRGRRPFGGEGVDRRFAVLAHGASTPIQVRANYFQRAVFDDGMSKFLGIFVVLSLWASGVGLSLAAIRNEAGWRGVLGMEQVDDGDGTADGSGDGSEDGTGDGSDDTATDDPSGGDDGDPVVVGPACTSDTGCVSGVIADEDGNVVRGVDVAIQQVDPSDARTAVAAEQAQIAFGAQGGIGKRLGAAALPRQQSITTAVSRDDGSYGVTFAEAGLYFVRFSRRGFDQSRHIVSVDADLAAIGLDVTLVPATGSLSGRVEAAADLLPAQVMVTDGTTRYATTTAADGSWSITGISLPAELLVVVTGADGSSTATTISLPEGSTGATVGTMRLTSGTTSAAGRLCPGVADNATITLRTEDGQERVQVSALGQLGSDGIRESIPFVFTGLPPQDAYDVVVIRDGYFTATDQLLPATSAELGGCTITLNPSVADLSGNVEFASEGPVPGGILVAVAGAQQTFSTTVGEDGTYAVEGLPAGDYVVSFSRPDIGTQVRNIQIVPPTPAELDVTVVQQTTDADLSTQVRIVLDGDDARVLRSQAGTIAPDALSVSIPGLGDELTEQLTEAITSEGTLDQTVPMPIGRHRLRITLAGHETVVLPFTVPPSDDVVRRDLDDMARVPLRTSIDDEAVGAPFDGELRELASVAIPITSGLEDALVGSPALDRSDLTATVRLEKLLFPGEETPAFGLEQYGGGLAEGTTNQIVVTGASVDLPARLPSGFYRLTTEEIPGGLHYLPEVATTEFTVDLRGEVVVPAPELTDPIVLDSYPVVEIDVDAADQFGVLGSDTLALVDSIIRLRGTGDGLLGTAVEPSFSELQAVCDDTTIPVATEAADTEAESLLAAIRFQPADADAAFGRSVRLEPESPERILVIVCRNDGLEPSWIEQTPPDPVAVNRRVPASLSVNPATTIELQWLDAGVVRNDFLEGISIEVEDGTEMFALTSGADGTVRTARLNDIPPDPTFTVDTTRYPGFTGVIDDVTVLGATYTLTLGVRAVDIEANVLRYAAGPAVTAIAEADAYPDPQLRDASGATIDPTCGPSTNSLSSVYRAICVWDDVPLGSYTVIAPDEGLDPGAITRYVLLEERSFDLTPDVTLPTCTTAGNEDDLCGAVDLPIRMLGRLQLDTNVFDQFDVAAPIASDLDTDVVVPLTGDATRPVLVTVTQAGPFPVAEQLSFTTTASAPVVVEHTDLRARLVNFDQTSPAPTATAITTTASASPFPSDRSQIASPLPVTFSVIDDGRFTDLVGGGSIYANAGSAATQPAVVRALRYSAIDARVFVDVDDDGAISDDDILEASPVRITVRLFQDDDFDGIDDADEFVDVTGPDGLPDGLDDVTGRPFPVPVTGQLTGQYTSSYADSTIGFTDFSLGDGGILDVLAQDLDLEVTLLLRRLRLPACPSGNTCGASISLTALPPADPQPGDYQQGTTETRTLVQGQRYLDPPVDLLLFDPRDVEITVVEFQTAEGYDLRSTVLCFVATPLAGNGNSNTQKGSPIYTKVSVNAAGSPTSAGLAVTPRRTYAIYAVARPSSYVGDCTELPAFQGPCDETYADITVVADLTPEPDPYRSCGTTTITAPAAGQTATVAFTFEARGAILAGTVRTSFAGGASQTFAGTAGNPVTVYLFAPDDPDGTPVDVDTYDVSGVIGSALASATVASDGTFLLRDAEDARVLLDADGATQAYRVLVASNEVVRAWFTTVPGSGDLLTIVENQLVDLTGNATGFATGLRYEEVTIDLGDANTGLDVLITPVTVPLGSFAGATTTCTTSAAAGSEGTCLVDLLPGLYDVESGVDPDPKGAVTVSSGDDRNRPGAPTVGATQLYLAPPASFSPPYDTPRGDDPAEPVRFDRTIVVGVTYSIVLDIENGGGAGIDIVGVSGALTKDGVTRTCTAVTGVNGECTVANLTPGTWIATVPGLNVSSTSPSPIVVGGKGNKSFRVVVDSPTITVVATAAQEDAVVTILGATGEPSCTIEDKGGSANPRYTCDDPITLASGVQANTLLRARASLDGQVSRTNTFAWSATRSVTLATLVDRVRTVQVLDAAAGSPVAGTFRVVEGGNTPIPCVMESDGDPVCTLSGVKADTAYTTSFTPASGTFSTLLPMTVTFSQEVSEAIKTFVVSGPTTTGSITGGTASTVTWSAASGSGSCDVTGGTTFTCAITTAVGPTESITYTAGNGAGSTTPSTSTSWRAQRTGITIAAPVLITVARTVSVQTDATPAVAVADARITFTGSVTRSCDIPPSGGATTCSLTGLVPGDYTVTVTDLSAGGATYTPAPTTQTVGAAATGGVTITVAVT